MKRRTPLTPTPDRRSGVIIFIQGVAAIGLLLVGCWLLWVKTGAH